MEKSLGDYIQAVYMYIHVHVHVSSTVGIAATECPFTRVSSETGKGLRER